MNSIDNNEEESLEEQCRCALRRLSAGSQVFNRMDSKLDESSDRVHQEDITVGDILGKGCFSNVREIQLCDVKKCPDRRDSIETSSTVNTSHTLWNPIEGSRRSCYAVKKLRDDLSNSKNKNGAIDLAVEAQFLKALSHPNIVSFHGIGASPGNKDFFIIIEQLDKTVDSEIKAWQYQEDFISRRGNCICGSDKTRRRGQLDQLFKRRLSVSHQLSSAIKYLHGRNIVYRDLKPTNVGINYYGVVKMFDFGLAKELKEERKVDDDQYRCTTRTGTLRYMAPEVYTSDLYGLPVDVYSFSIVLWEILALDVPFFGFCSKKFAKKVILKNHRPRIIRRWPKELKNIIRNGWSQDPSCRPGMDEIHEVLGSYLSKIDVMDVKRN